MNGGFYDRTPHHNTVRRPQCLHRFSQSPEQHPWHDIEIAQAATPKPITEIAEALNIPDEAWSDMAASKARSIWIGCRVPVRNNARMILVTAVSPTPAGEGKTTTTVGGDALKHIGKNVAICLREPSLGPVLGAKGGAARRLRAGDSHGRHQPALQWRPACDRCGQQPALCATRQPHSSRQRQVSTPHHLKRVLDMNDRALRDITVALGGPGNGYPRQDGFDIVVASEIMAIFCLATDLDDRKRLGHRSGLHP